ncbi:hypothetical protein F5882DRAFT_340026 [Hyaloscypha sp. PMI_1271]|nr:hypothetical protein F5882DRAFT_340026 [Hyaloscypha sp. PMI_1271]
MSTPTVPVYFEQSWAILSSIGLTNVLFGLMVVGITSLSPVSLVPIVVSVAGSVANGLCYYAFYADYPKTGTVVAAGIADMCWLIQEAGLSFYSYLILTRVLKNRSRVIFLCLFWTIMAVLLTLRIFILASRAKDILEGNTSRQITIDHLHVGYFSSIALVECISAFFLLRKFASARRTSIEASSTSGLFSYLMRSTEIRLATLAIIGFSRAITYSFQTTAQSATTPASQLDRFVYTLECMFPVMLFIDILASKLVVSNHIHESSSQSRSRNLNNASSRKQNNGLSSISMYPISHVETRVDAHGGMSSSQERIFQSTVSQAGTHNSNEESQEFQQKDGVITKTVEFDFHDSAA